VRSGPNPGFFSDDLIAKLHCLCGLLFAKVIVRRARDVVVPRSAANCIEYYPLRAVIGSVRRKLVEAIRPVA
jgi:hypothetical protein